MKETRKVIYYKDALNDEFSLTEITPKKIDGDYVYVHTSPIKRFTHFFWYRIVATPLAWLYLKFKFGHKIKNAAALKKCGKSGYFIYGNHTQDIGDALIPSFVCYPKHVYTVVHANNVSMPVLGRITPSLGALPLPDTVSAARNFIRAIEKRVNDGHPVCIYPEAHIWPFYTDIRPFTDVSFRYPVMFNKPVYCLTNTYHQKKPGGRVRIITYVDGPFYPDRRKKKDAQKRELRDAVYSAMKIRAALSNAEVIKYVRKSSDD